MALDLALNAVKKEHRQLALKNKDSWDSNDHLIFYKFTRFSIKSKRLKLSRPGKHYTNCHHG